MNEMHSAVERFNISRRKLTTALEGLQDSFNVLGLNSVAPLLETLRQRLETERLKVLIVGQFKQGKSTLINALLGAEVLPAFAVPCTAVINEIKYGDTRRAVVHFRDPIPSPLPERLSSEARQHIEWHAGKDVPPMEVPIEELESYVVIPDPARDQGESVAESPFSLVEIFWPIELCRHGVEIIDSPGLNEHGTRTRVTVDYLSQVDAVAFVLSCIALAGETEISFIENNLRTSGHEEIFFACNRFDQVRDRERQRVMDFGREKLARLTSFGADGVFFLSALDALEGRLDGHDEKLQRSGFPEFEKRLSLFLMESRGRLKLLKPARQLTTEVNKALHEAIPQQQRMLKASTKELEERWAEIQPQANQTKNRCRQVLERVERERERLRMEIRDKMESFIRQLADEIPAWVAAYQPKNAIKFVSLNTSSQANALIKEISEFVDAKVETSVARWQQETLMPFVQKRLLELGEGLRQSLDQISLEVLEIKHKLTGQPLDGALTGEKAVGTLERVLSAGAGWFLTGPGGAMLGGMFGYKELAKSLGPAFAIAVGTVIIGVFNPILLIALLIGSSTIQGLFKVKAMTEKIKNACGDQISVQLKDKASLIAKEGADALYTVTGDMQAQIKAGLTQEIQSVTDLANAVLRDKRQGEAQVQERLTALEAIANDLRQSQVALSDIVFDLAQ